MLPKNFCCADVEFICLCKKKRPLANHFFAAGEIFGG
jgi:hypothetical protein